MKPLNLDNKPCSPISSNCVVWQGPDIPCIKLCTGDTVSDVVSAMATELCTILDTLKVSNYDLTCFNLQACGPQDFQALIQFLIDKICELEGITPETKEEPACPDCVVSVAECFRTGTQTTMQLVDYVQLIGERICSIAEEISLINAQITDILIRITNLENTPAPTFTLPTFTLDCTVGSLTGVQAIDTVLIEFINNVWCGFYAETGTAGELDSAAKQKCLNDSDIQLNTGTAFSTNPNWITDANYDTLADAINNIWVVLCDAWNYANTLSTITVADTPTIDLELSPTQELTAVIQDTGWKDLEGFSYIQFGSQPQCRRIGNILYFKGTLTVPIGKTLNGGGGDAESITTDDSYNGIQRGFTLNTVQSTSSDACLLLTSNDTAWIAGQEAIRCLFNGGNSCIPTGILNINGETGETLDSSGGNLTGNVIGTRFARTSTGKDYTLSGIVRLSINSSGVLRMNSANFEDIFKNDFAANGKASMLRQFCSNAVTGELIPQFDVASVTSSIFGIDPSSPTPPHTSQLSSSAAAGADNIFSFDQNLSRAEQIGGLQVNLSSLQVIINQS